MPQVDEPFAGRWRRSLRVLLLAVLSAMGPGVAFAALDAPARLALVIGNAAYPDMPSRTSVDDAALVSESLALAGFDVTAAIDLDAADLGAAVAAFETKARDAGGGATLFVYVAGYGVQWDGRTYFAPVDAKMERDADVPRSAYRLDDLEASLATLSTSARIFVYDLARANPFVAIGDTPLAPGLALVPAGAGALRAYNTAPGLVAPPDVGRYGAYARALSEMILTPGLAIDAMFVRVRLRAGELTDGAIVPWDDDKLGEVAPLIASSSVAKLAPQASMTDLSPAIAYSVAVAGDTFEGYLDFLRLFPHDRLSPRIDLLCAARRESLFWGAVRRDDEPRGYWTYMRRYERGPHYFDARRRLAALGAPLAPPPRFDLVPVPDVPPPQADESALVDGAPIVLADPDWPPIPAPDPTLLPPTRVLPAPGDVPPQMFASPVLPVSVPVLSAATSRLPRIGLVRQWHPSAAATVARTMLGPGIDDATVEVFDDDRLVSRSSIAADGSGRRLIGQVGPLGKVISRTTIIGSPDGATIVQTGPGGGVISKSVTWTEPGGASATMVRDGGNRIVADIKRNADGIVVSATGTDGPPPRAIAPSVPAAPHPDAATGSVGGQAPAVRRPAPEVTEGPPVPSEKGTTPVKGDGRADVVKDAEPPGHQETKADEPSTGTGTAPLPVPRPTPPAGTGKADRSVHKGDRRAVR